MSFRFRRIIAFDIALSSSLILFALGSWCWLLRDGLGPDSIESSGGEALRRFIADFWPVALLCLVLFAIAFFVAPRQSSTHNASTNATGNA